MPATGVFLACWLRVEAPFRSNDPSTDLGKLTPYLWSVVTAVLTAGCSRFVEKPWGSEQVFTEVGLPYVGKLIRVRAGHRLSLQVHDEKTETMTLLNGAAILVLEDLQGTLHEFCMEPGRGYTIIPGVRHRLCGQTDALVLEVSTPERGTTLRLEDDYGRPDETRP